MFPHRLTNLQSVGHTIRETPPIQRVPQSGTVARDGKWENFLFREISLDL